MTIIYSENFKIVQKNCDVFRKTPHRIMLQMMDRARKNFLMTHNMSEEYITPTVGAVLGSFKSQFETLKALVPDEVLTVVIEVDKLFSKGFQLKYRVTKGDQVNVATGTTSMTFLSRTTFEPVLMPKPFQRVMKERDPGAFDKLCQNVHKKYPSFSQDNNDDKRLQPSISEKVTDKNTTVKHHEDYWDEIEEALKQYLSKFAPNSRSVISTYETKFLGMASPDSTLEAMVRKGDGSSRMMCAFNVTLSKKGDTVVAEAKIKVSFLDNQHQHTPVPQQLCDNVVPTLGWRSTSTADVSLGGDQSQVSVSPSI